MACSRDGCDREAVVKGKCISHYNSDRAAHARAAARAKTRVCAYCGASFSGRDTRAMYCTMECKTRARGKRRERKSRAKPPRENTRSCGYCGASLSGRPIHTRYCTRECSRRASALRDRLERNRALNRKCRICGNPIDELAILGTIYCSEECRHLTERAKRYGTTGPELLTILAAHDGRCAICGTDKPGGIGKWHVDHCHASMKVRGVLCQNCNFLLGHARDDVAILRAAIRYLT